jgi:predicted pyridoxine 5'-phosphate oxidase superfamily flavin-nucleotide-binding protein
MVSIPKHVQDFLPGKLAWVATASREGIPNVTPKGSLTLLDEHHVRFADLFSLKTGKNLLENKNVEVTVVDPGTGKGYQITCGRCTTRGLPGSHRADLPERARKDTQCRSVAARKISLPY